MFLVGFAYALVGLIWFLNGIKEQEEKEKWDKIAEAMLSPKLTASPDFMEGLQRKIDNLEGEA